MKKNSMNLFVGLHTAIATVLVLSSAAQGQTLYWDPNGTTAGFGNFAGNWNGTATNWNTDATGGAGGSLTATTSSSNAASIGGAGPTGVIVVSGTQTAASIDFANTSQLAAMRVGTAGGPVMSLAVTGDITDSGAGSADIRIVNMNLSNAATILTANSISIGVINFAEESFGNAQYWTTGYNMTLATQFSLGRGNGNYTYTQNAGTFTVNDAARGISFNPDTGTTSNTTGTRVHSYIMNGGQLQVGAIGVNTPNNGNNNTTNNWSSQGRLEFNAGTIRNVASGGTLLFQNGLSFKDYNGSGTKDMQYNTHLPFNVVLSQTGTRTLDANGANSSILVTPGVQFVNKTGENGSLTKTGLGSLVFTGGGPVAVNSYTGSTTVTAGLVSTDYNRIAGQAATGGTDNLSNGYSAGSQLVLNGGNYSLVGRGSAAAGSATGVTLDAGALNVTVASTAGLVIGQSVTNANLPAGTYIRRILSGTQIELNAMSTSTSNQASQTLTFGAASFNNTQAINSVDLQQAGNATTITVTPGAGTSTTLLSFGDVSGSGGFTKAGTGTLKLTGNVSYTGPTAITAGTLEFASAGNQTLTAPVTGSGTLMKSGAGTLTMDSVPAAGRHDFTGAVIVNGGTLANAASAEGLYRATSFTVNSGGILQTGADGLGFGGSMGSLTVNAGGTFKVDGDQQMNAVTLNGGLIDFANVNLSMRGNVTVGGNSTSTIQGPGIVKLGGSDDPGNTTRTFAVADATSSAAADLVITSRLGNAHVSNNAVNLEKTGAGTMLLSGNSTYTGTTTVSAGTLAINGDNSAVTGDVSVNGSGTRLIGSNGTVGGNTTIGSGAIHSAGGAIANSDKVGKQTFDQAAAATTNLTYGAGSIFEWDLNAKNDTDSGGLRGTDYDAVDVTGTLSVNGTAIFRVVLGTGATTGDLSFWQQNQTWSDVFGGGFASSGSFTNSLLQVVDAATGSTFDVSNLYSGAGSGFSISGSSLTWTAVPEPTSALAGLLLTAGLLRRRRSA